MKNFDWNGLTLLPERAVWREATRTLFVADVHLGKDAAFRGFGLAVPTGATAENLARLDALISAHAPRRLVVLGDLFHARAAFRGACLAEILQWRATRADLAITLVAGNHDLGAGAPPAALALECAPDPFVLDGIECRHVPREHGQDIPRERQDAGPLVLAGHVHPAARLTGPGYDRLRLPCFVLDGRQLILPAFGEFTGGAVVRPDAATELLAVAGNRLLSIPAERRRDGALRKGQKTLRGVTFIS